MKKNHFHIMLILCAICYFVFPKIYTAVVNEYPASLHSSVKKTNEENKKNQITLDNLGQFGSSFGALNAFLTAISLFILGLSLIYQTWQYSEQQKINSIRDIENNFFKLIDHIRSTVQSIDVTQPSGAKTYGGEAFSKMVYSMRNIDKNIRKNTISGYRKIISKTISKKKKTKNLSKDSIDYLLVSRRH